MTDIALVVLTGALVLATCALVRATLVLSKHSSRSADEAQKARIEMERTRDLSVRPQLAFDVHLAGGIVGFLLIRNVGPGVAVDVDLSMEVHGERRRWTEGSVVPGESHQFKLPPAWEKNVFDAAEKGELLIRFDGNMNDVYGRREPIHAELDVGAWARKIMGARGRIKGRRKLPGADAE